MSMESNKPLTWSMVRYVLVFLTLGLVTWNYFSFSHYVHQSHHFEPPHGNPNEHGKEDPHGHGHGHGRGGSFDKMHLKKDGLFLYGLALPLLLLTLASLIWNPSTSTMGTTTSTKNIRSTSEKENSKGDVNVQKWTIIWFLVPLLLVMYDSARGHDIFNSNSQEKQMGWNLYIRICMSLMSPSGYAAIWALAVFLIPVTKHSPILDWLHVTPVQALAFHRVAGWTSFWNSVLHGFLHLRHLMDVLNPQRSRPWYQQLKILLVPSSWKCLGTQNPWEVFFGRQDPYDGTDEEANQCWLALVNATGMISVIAFVLLAITSLPQVRRYSYTLFYTVHIPSAWIMLIMAVWHYPTCALVLIPNIIYYLSFNIPVYVTQAIDNWSLKESNNRNSSPLVEANLIQGGSIELTFATTKDRHRHESRFARVICPSVSPLSHPFSIFSRQELMNFEADTMGDNDSSLATISMLLRPTGPFTKKLTKVLFPNHHANSTQETSRESAEELFDSLMSVPLIAQPSDHMIQIDSYYAGSFGWVDKAMKSHSDILLVAGGVGIVPFLEFLPSLQQRIQMDAAAAVAAGEGTAIDSEVLLESDTQFGPKQVHLHWYCREVGLASYVWNHHLRRHVEDAWESNPACQGRLKIHFHLTSLNTEVEGGEEILTSFPNSGVMDKHLTQEAAIRPVQDAQFTQFPLLGLLLPGIIMAGGTILHWWWYKQFIIDDKFEHDNLIIRSHSIIFTLVLAIVVSVPVEHYLRYRKSTVQLQSPVSLVDHSDTESPSQAETASTTSMEKQGQNNTFLTVSAGRPSMESVVCDVITADRPGVYSCGPRPMMESVENMIRRKRIDCAFYREDSEM